MNRPLDGAVELLDRSLAYTRGTLAGVRPDLLDRPTPCSAWRLGQLLAHMEDSLDAFLEAAAGEVALRPVARAESRVDSLREKACALLATWAEAAPTWVGIGDAGLQTPLLVAAAALEITVHGWDVGQATGAGTPVPAGLASALIGIAPRLVPARARGPFFAIPAPTCADAPASTRLLGYLGRDVSGPSGGFGARNAPTRGVAS